MGLVIVVRSLVVRSRSKTGTEGDRGSKALILAALRYQNNFPRMFEGTLHVCAHASRINSRIDLTIPSNQIRSSNSERKK